MDAVAQETLAFGLIYVSCCNTEVFWLTYWRCDGLGCEEGHAGEGDVGELHDGVLQGEKSLN